MYYIHNKTLGLIILHALKLYFSPPETTFAYSEDFAWVY